MVVVVVYAFVTNALIYQKTNYSFIEKRNFSSEIFVVSKLLTE